MSQYTLVDKRRAILLLVLGLIAIATDLTGLDFFGIQTLSDAITTFAIITVGGYLGLTASDYLLNRHLAE